MIFKRRAAVQDEFVVDELLRQRVQQARIGWLQRPGRRRRIIRVEASQIELVHRVARRGGRIVEIPIRFTERVRGDSKMSGRIVAEPFLLVTWWGFRDRLWKTAK